MSEAGDPVSRALQRADLQAQIRALIVQRNQAPAPDKAVFAEQIEDARGKLRALR